MENEKLLRYAHIGVILLGALLAAVCAISLIVVPKTLRALDRLHNTLTGVDSLVETAEATLVIANNVADSVDSLVETAEATLTNAEATLATANAAADSANKLVADNAGAVAEAMKKINSVDFAALNRAIRDLADVVAPLAKVSNLLNR